VGWEKKERIGLWGKNEYFSSTFYIYICTYICLYMYTYVYVYIYVCMCIYMEVAQ
jgi:hypothetical protein